MLKNPGIKCLMCESPLIGRRDKRFCTDSCRSIYHQQHKKLLPEVVKSINQILIRNRNLLSDLNPEGKRSIPKSVLLQSGFDFRYHTHNYLSKTGNQYWYVYDQGYTQISEERLLLVRHQQQVNGSVG